MGLYERLFNTSFMAVIQTVFLTAKTKLTEALCQYGVIGGITKVLQLSS